MTDLNDIFSRVYREHEWGYPSSPRTNTKFYSGGGAEAENDKGGAYVKLVQEYVKKSSTFKVVEIGCGDFEIGQRIDWRSVDYTGYDVVPELIEHNQVHYGKTGIKFVCHDVVFCDPTSLVDAQVCGDLLIVKDVFQHLPPSYCAEFVKSIPYRFKYNLVTNDLGGNTEIAVGGYSGNDFSKPPFDMKVKLLLQWVQKSEAAGNKQTVTLNDY